MNEDTPESELRVTDTHEHLDEFLDSFEADLRQIRQDIGLLHSKKKPKKKPKKRPRISHQRIIDLEELKKLTVEVKNVILDGEQSERMLGTRCRTEIDRHIQRLKGPADKTKAPDADVPAPVAGVLGEATEQIVKEAAPTVSAKALKSALLRSEKARGLEQLLAGVKKANAAPINKLEGPGGLRTEDVEAILEFYTLYALFTEYFNSMKVLYQVLLKEYEELDLLDDDDVMRLRRLAIHRIAARLLRHKWRGADNANNREVFRNKMLRSVRLHLHDRSEAAIRRRGYQPSPSALCLSGGGIRSATFSLGVIQSLAKHGLLDKFDYLSTVSGGGFVGSWLTAWIYRNRKRGGIKTVQEKLIETPVGTVESPEITYLRSYSNYMSPRVGLLSADTWTLIAVYLRNLLLNWTVFIPLLAALLLLPTLLVEILKNGERAIVGLAPSNWAAVFVGIASLFGVFALFWINIFRPSMAKYVGRSPTFSQVFRRDDIGVVENSESKVLWRCLVPLLLLAFGLTTYWFWAARTPQRRELIVTKTTEFVAGNYIAILSVTLAIFVVLAVINIFHGRKRKQKSFWDIVFESVIFLFCIVVAALMITQQPTGMFELVVYSQALFIAGFLLSRLATVLVRQKKRDDRLWDNAPIEFAISFLAASLGGTLLFLADKLLVELYAAARDTGEPMAGAAAIYLTVAVPLFLTVFLLAATLFVGIGSKILDDMDREWVSRLGAWISIVATAWLVVFGLVLIGPSVLSETPAFLKSSLASVGGIAGAITLLFGYYGKNLANEDSAGPKSRKSSLARLAPLVAAPIFAAFLLLLIVIGTRALIAKAGPSIPFLAYSSNGRSESSILAIALWISILAVFGSLMGWWVNVNRFSLHATYRERLIRAYLGASRGTERLETANSFTGLDERDNVEMFELFHKKLFHVVNMTLNIAKSESLRWQTRKAASFTATPFHCGSSNMGDGSGNYRKSRFYGANKAGDPITLGTAAAISGAAASPNMGYFTQSAPVSALMALFNIRLGWWLGNPGRHGADTFYKNAPEFSPRPLVREALGRTRDTSPYVYLSDGGHFDNLGLYEMVLRRCRFIVVCDAGADGKFGFSDLGTAIHKIRVDMGIAIEFGAGDLPIIGRNCSLGSIKYSQIDGSPDTLDGVLIYIKPTLDNDVPIDIVNYQKKCPDFPHESTADQMYNELQFESYRSLGFHMMNSICKGTTGNLDGLKKDVDVYLDKCRARTNVSGTGTVAIESDGGEQPGVNATRQKRRGRNPR